MRIAVDLTSLADNLSGIERYALNMALELLKLNTRDTFELIFKGEVYPDFQAWEDSPNVHFHVLKPCKKLPFNQWRLPRYLNRLKADRYLFLAFPMPVLLRGKHVYGTIHDMGCWDCPETMKRQMVWYFRLSYRCMARKAERIITISEFSKKRIRTLLKVPEEKIVVAYCGLSRQFQTMGSAKDGARPDVQGKSDKTESAGGLESPDAVKEPETARLREKYHLPEQYYLCLSTLEPRKNMQLLLDVYLKLYQEGNIHTPLVLAGRKGWKIDELLARAKDVKGETTGADRFAKEKERQMQFDGEREHECEDDPVRVTGFIEDDDLPAIYRMAKCFVFPSVYEGFGIPPLEAMSQGVQVIASDASSIPEILGDAAIYFKNNDADDLRGALLQMEQGGFKDLERRVEAGLRRSREFSYEREAGKVMEALHAEEQ